MSKFTNVDAAKLLASINESIADMEADGEMVEEETFVIGLTENMRVRVVVTRDCDDAGYGFQHVALS